MSDNIYDYLDLDDVCGDHIWINEGYCRYCQCCGKLYEKEDR